MKITIEFDTETFTVSVSDTLGNRLVLLGAMMTTVRNIVDAQPINGFRQFEQGDMVTYTVSGSIGRKREKAGR